MRYRFRKARPKPCGKTTTAGGSKASATKCISLEASRDGMISRAIIQHDSGSDLIHPRGAPTTPKARNSPGSGPDDAVIAAKLLHCRVGFEQGRGTRCGQNLNGGMEK